ncbi:hypothetical protein MKZ24_22050 [Paenibacillus sp. FSL R7-0297]|uniref:hypothetical protein n=1 Tax=unclassified Paenibacillus TaxID=185978 RepID=UPI0030F5D2BA
MDHTFMKNIDPYFMRFDYSDTQKVATSEHKLDDDGLGLLIDSIEHTKQDPSAFAANFCLKIKNYCWKIIKLCMHSKKEPSRLHLYFT